MYDDKFARYYDEIYADKDYQGEIDLVLEGAKLYAKGLKIDRILDVGCGTGGHTFEFARRGYDVVGVDLSPAMINVAEIKRRLQPERRLRFYCCDIKALDEHNFDLAASLFNVVNHIESLGELLAFFKAVNERLCPDGLYFFDCWNGLAALLDPPKNSELVTRRSDGRVMKKTSVAKTNFLKQEANIACSVTFYEPVSKEVEQIDFNLRHTLWPPKVLSESLYLSGFDVIAISRLGDLNIPATHEDWKIMFVARRMTSPVAKALTNRTWTFGE